MQRIIISTTIKKIDLHGIFTIKLNETKRNVNQNRINIINNIIIAKVIVTINNGNSIIVDDTS